LNPTRPRQGSARLPKSPTIGIGIGVVAGMQFRRLVDITYGKGAYEDIMASMGAGGAAIKSTADGVAKHLADASHRVSEVPEEVDDGIHEGSDATTCPRWHTAVSPYGTATTELFGVTIQRPKGSVMSMAARERIES